MEKFNQLRISKDILRAIEAAGFVEPSEIQEKTIPLVIQGKDVIGSSATGSGKTLAFGAGIFDRIKRGGGVQALVLTPTRELAEQVAKSLRAFSKYCGLAVREVYGGVSFEPQVRAIRESEIIVGTPGRILDHLNRRTLSLSKVNFLILDEADRMLEMGFIEDVEKIIKECPEKRQTLLFSATFSHDLQRIAKKYMTSPVFVEAESYVDASKLRQVYYDVPNESKFSLLAHFLKNEKKGLVMVFCNTRRNTDLVARNLNRHKIHALAIHGGLTQNKRNEIMNTFHSNEALILVCTDVAARGLDIKNVSHVYNYDSPKTSTEYIHRIGRTARAGKEGIAVTLISNRDYENFSKVKGDSSLNIERADSPQFEILSVSFKEDFREKVGRGNFRGRAREGRSSNFRERIGSSSGGRQRGRFSGSLGGSREGFGRDSRSRGRFGGRSGERPRSGFNRRPRRN